MKKDRFEYIFLLNKGIGDLIIVSTFLKLTKSRDNVTLYLANRYKSLKYLFVSKNVTVKLISDSFSSIYFIKNKFFSIFSHFNFYLFLYKNMNNKSKIIFPDNYIKNFIFFPFINKKISSDYYVYNFYEKFFSIKVPITKSIKNNNKKFLIFPFGNHFKRRLSSNIILEIINFFNKNNLTFVIAVFKDDLNFLDKNIKSESIYNFTNIKDLDKYMINFDNVITVDTFFLHLAIQKNKNIYILSDSWKKYIPKKLIEFNKLFKYSKMNDLFAKINLDFHLYN